MAQLSKLYNQYKEITKVLREIDINDKDIADRVELYKYQIDEITSANLKIGEDEELHEKRKILSNSHKLHKLIDDSLNYISRSSGANAMDCISYAIDNLNTIAEIDEDRAGLADDLHNIYAYMEDIVNKLSHYADTIESNPEELSVVEDRLQLIYDLKKKYGNTIEDINKFKETVSVKLEKIENSEELLKEYMNSQSGKVSIGASELTMRFFLLPYIEQFQQRFPNVTVQIHSNSAPITASSLKAGENDFAVIISPIHEIMKDLDLVHVMPVAEFQDIVIAGNRFSELQNRTLSLEELCMHPLVSMESGTTTRLFWDNLFEEQGLDLRPSIEVSSNDLIAPTVSHNLGIGFVPSEFARNYLLNYRVFQLHLNIPIPKRQILVLQNPMRPLTPAAQAFLDMLKQPVQESIGNGQPVLLHP